MSNPNQERIEVAKQLFYKVMAREFHDTYERLAPDFGYETRTDTKVFNPESHNGQLMIAVTREVVEPHIRRLEGMIATETQSKDARIAELEGKVEEYREACKKALTCASLNSDVRNFIQSVLDEKE